MAPEEVTQEGLQTTLAPVPPAHQAPEGQQARPAPKSLETPLEHCCCCEKSNSTSRKNLRSVRVLALWASRSLSFFARGKKVQL